MNDRTDALDLEGQVRAQAEKIQGLEDAGKNAKSITAIIGLGSALAGIVVGAMGFAFTVRDELAIWEQIKIVHTNDDTRSGVVLYDHTNLDPKEIEAIALALALPDFEQFAMKSEVPKASEFIRNGDLVSLKNVAGFLRAQDHERSERDVTVVPSSDHAQTHFELQRIP